MPPAVMQQKLLLLQAAAADADAACAIMAGLSQAHAQDQVQQEQQLKQVQEAVNMLERATEARQQHVAAGNQLLGYSHHATAAAAVEAAVLAAVVAGLQHGDASGSTAAGDTAARVLGSVLQQSMGVLQDSLAMQTEAEVCSVLLRLQQLLQELRDKVPACSSASSRRAQSVAAVLQLACSCYQHSTSQENQRQNTAQSLGVQGRKSAHLVLQSSLLQAFRHFCNSTAVLACNQPQDSLALATERIACCASGLALVGRSRLGRMSCAGCAEAEQRLQQHEQGACGRCSAVLGVVGEMLRQAVIVVEAHLGSPQWPV
jgi:hypothetical protein